MRYQQVTVSRSDHEFTRAGVIRGDSSTFILILDLDPSTSSPSLFVSSVYFVYCV
jgi:hypothetical protein